MLYRANVIVSAAALFNVRNGFCGLVRQIQRGHDRHDAVTT